MRGRAERLKSEGSDVGSRQYNVRAGWITAQRGVIARVMAVRGWRAAGAARKGGTPGEGSPFNPLLRFFSIREFRALRRAARAPPLDPARFFVKKRGKKLLDASLHPALTPRPWGE